MVQGPSAQHLVLRHAQGGVAFSLLVLRRQPSRLRRILGQRWQRPPSRVHSPLRAASPWRWLFGSIAEPSRRGTLELSPYGLATTCPSLTSSSDGHGTAVLQGYQGDLHGQGAGGMLCPCCRASEPPTHAPLGALPLAFLPPSAGPPCGRPGAAGAIPWLSPDVKKLLPCSLPRSPFWQPVTKQPKASFQQMQPSAAPLWLRGGARPPPCAAPPPLSSLRPVPSPPLLHLPPSLLGISAAGVSPEGTAGAPGEGRKGG